ncbi:MAG: SDR family NAD(P)-dependent oxidoreductase, partial [Candidatus Competibacter denitrificans]
MLNRFDLSGKVAIVTGCNTGLGQGMAVALAEAGADVVGVNRSAATETHAAITAVGRRFHEIRAELSDMAVLQPVVEEACQAFGQIDIL